MQREQRDQEESYAGCMMIYVRWTGAGQFHAALNVELRNGCNGVSI
jgi:hypothetical protein